MAMEFLVNGIEMFDETGAFLAFEEHTDELVANVKSLNYDLTKHLANNKIYIEHLKINSDVIKETGKYDLEGLFIRLDQAIKKVNAKRVVLDSLDSLFHGLDPKILRSEFKRLLTWLKEREVTAIITSEIGDSFFTRNGLMEYVADCVIMLDNRIANQITTRRLRILKYRGSYHGNNEYPFVIDENGISVFSFKTNTFQPTSSTERITSGIKDLDEMLGYKGFYKGSSILISGTAGTGKTSIASSFAYSICHDKMKCLFCVFEETPNQIIRNMRSIGFDLEPLVTSDVLSFYYARPTLQNLELHFLAIKKLIAEIQPSVIILDPITNLMRQIYLHRHPDSECR
jgi:circadian clock protein KaiC